jgi:crotonobetainyl-CoA:carnitine CoA-transferase CaiB-like acyl-CoA transferase
MANSTQPLTGLVVVELGTTLAGPYAARIFADLGAEVIKVENPAGGDTTRQWSNGSLGGESPSFQAVNSHKKSVTADLSDPDVVEAVKRLIDDRADVVFQNMRPGSLEAMGLGAREALERKPSLIYCNIGAYGDYGEYANYPGYEPAMQAFTGIAEATGEAGGDPVRVGFSVLDFSTGMWAVIGTLAALRRRDETGEGTIVDAALMESGLSFQTLSHALWQATGEEQKRSGLKGPIIVPNNGYEAADGKMIIACGTASQYGRLCDAIGRSDLKTDSRFADNVARAANEDALTAELERTLSTDSREAWAAKLNAAGVPNAPVQSLAEAMVHPQIAAGAQVQTAPDGSFERIGLPLRFDGERPAFSQSGPALGADNELLEKD